MRGCVSVGVWECVGMGDWEFVFGLICSNLTALDTLNFRTTLIQYPHILTYSQTVFTTFHSIFDSNYASYSCFKIGVTAQTVGIGIDDKAAFRG